MGNVMPSTTTSTNLLAFFAFLDGSHDVSVCTSGDAVQWSNASSIAGAESGGDSPAAAMFQGKVFVAFVAKGSGRIAICSSSDGKTFGSPAFLDQTGQASPSLCVFDGKLWLAFIANNSSNDILICSTEDGLKWSATSKVHQASTLQPSLCVYKDKIHLAFTVQNVDFRYHDLFICSSSNGVDWSAATKLNESVGEAASLCVFKDKLWLAYSASGDNTALLIVSSSDGIQFSDRTATKQACSGTPSLCALDDTMYVCFISANERVDLLVCSSTDGAHWSDNVNIGQKSAAGPALLAQQFTAGTVRPLYQITTVVYAPPGTNGGKSTSNVVYASSSSAGTTSSISQSLKGGVEVSAKVGDDKAFSAGLSFAYSNTGTDTTTLDIKKTDSYALSVGGPGADGIDHDHDMYYLALNPLVTITVDNWNNVTWAMGVDGSTMEIQYVYTGWLKDPSKMPEGLKSKLDTAGLTTNDYAKILESNPFSNGPAAIDPARYMPTGQSFPYIPPFGPNDPVPVQTYKHENSITISESSKVEQQYTVTATVTAGMPNAWSTKVAGTLQWTNTNTSGTSSTNTQSAQVSVGGPAYGYSGPTDVLVYWDTVYNTFMFAFPTGAPDASGSVSSATGASLANEKVTMTLGGKTYTTYTDANGDYRFYGTGAGEAEVMVKGQSHRVIIGGAQRARLEVAS